MPGRVLLAGAGAWALGWLFRAWLEADVLFAWANGAYGCG
ncbi:hypothetical protein BN940_11591 [Castellaniella defragrans 65Phen]|uniref:Uncharacterized protein n=1 Tax=Castellaniella defragrans (strain DSM 12143 / CCUG 39792 / 65Phen) TaxID=1437824 RepID=W8X506_CASD6|nr:hypothetical protein BN940_11591 [Castellaniella defragrans 65Phen]